MQMQVIAHHMIYLHNKIINTVRQEKNHKKKITTVVHMTFLNAFSCKKMFYSDANST